MKPRLMLALTFATAVFLGAIGSAQAKGPKTRKMRFVERGRSLTVNTNFTELLDSENFTALSSGFPMRIVLHLLVYQDGYDTPVAVQRMRKRVVYDLWDETYLLEETGPGGTREIRFGSRVQLLRRLTQLRRHPIAKLEDVGIGPHYFLVIVAQLNPVEDAELAEMRRWLSKSSSESKLNSSSSFFGSFVSVFANPKLAKAERVVRLRSQPFYRVKQ
ncbi:MAG: DUF4390 domain-containing protein [Myxococcales bacterium]|nr:DUF4390 domain-containing protein [Myxococcales bacterium]